MSKYTSVFAAAEVNTVCLKKNARYNVALIYPNTYSLGMSNLGVHAVYGLLNDRQDTLCERFFVDPACREMLSIESNRPLKSFDILAFSISYELDFLNFFAVLRSLGLSAPREQRPVMPLIIVGGAVNAFNVAPLSRFSDAIFSGEAEESLPVFMDALADSGRISAYAAKERFLRSVAGEKGIFVPGFSAPEQAAPRFCAEIDAFATGSKIITPRTEFSNMFLIEVSRGCPWHCRFCVTGAVCGSFRPRKLETLVPLIEQGLRYTSKIGLVGAAVSDYPQIDELASLLRERKARISVSSLRVETTRESLLSALADSGQRTITFAPEAGSERLRRSLNKNISDDQLLDKVALAKHCGIEKIKLYFMVGLPGEEESDITAIAALAKRVRKILPVRLNVGIFVPKPKTPFAREKFADKPVLSRRLTALKRQLRSEKNISVQTSGILEAAKEALFASADENFFNGIYKF
ncbi:MAG: radical SAM protein [Candidatus Omnitrophica bacterium]|nr:radical SAM protein [Candidatus Omnitrophota bacterium]